MKIFQFKKARPVWAQDRALEKNCELAFRAILPRGDYKLFLAASSIYRIWVNGVFAAAGPARAPHGYYRVDEHPLGGFLNKEENVIVVEVVGYNVNTYDTLDQPSFLTAEIRSGGQAQVWTGEDGIPVYDLRQRVQDAPRYSFQRAFAESYTLSSAKGRFYVKTAEEFPRENVEVQPDKTYICREVRMPLFERLEAEPFPGEVQAGEGTCMYVLPYNATGFFQIEVTASEDSRIKVEFDEILVDGKLDFQRMKSFNCFTYKIEPGRYLLTSFAPYTMKYIKIKTEGAAAAGRVSFIEYKHPPVKNKIRTEDGELEIICRAALESFRSCSLDTFMDCPSRERGGWLCDSYFTSSVEHVLTGENVLERVFLENFLVNDTFACLPEGMLPMCYPADHYDGNFIPNWAMWYVLELEKYWERTGDTELLQQAEKRIDALLDYFLGFENELGLLENLEGWVFVEWSRANDKDLVSGVNFPTNMLYARMLQAAGRLYHRPELMDKAGQLRSVIRKYSFNGRFYTDNMHRDGITLVNSNVCTEVCQYYAFFTGTADTKRDAALWQVLLNEFGPEREAHNTYPEIAFTNAFIGQYLRIELLYQNHCYDEVIKNIKSCFLPMARETGTLWEHKKPAASCDHGFASYVLYWLAGICGIEADIKWLDEAEVFRVGKLPAHSDHLCFLDEAEAEEGNSSFAKSLNGTWQFCYSRAPGLRPADFYREDFDAGSFGTISVPSHIELEGYDHVHYMNKMYPWESISFRRPADVLEDKPHGCGSFVETDYNPVGSYRKTFDLPEGMRGNRIILRFDGVEQAMFVWLNGKFIGYSEDSYTPAEFDLTPHIRHKGNLLCVEVYKWSTAAFLEDQDYFRFFGVFRSVWLLARPCVHVEDMDLRPVLFDDGSTGELRVGLRASGGSQGAMARIRLKDPENHTVAEAVSTLSPKTEVFFEKLTGIRPWSHFTPVLYELQVQVTDADGTAVEFAVSKLGFRRIDVVGKKLLLNGKRLRICGVNRHEWNGHTGRCVSDKDMERDMQVLKRNHINAVRTSHYPNQVKWYSMCDENGIYVMAETNLESHGSWQKLGETEPSWNIPGCSRVWEKAVLDRAANNYELLKNHPSILFWSLGNEAYAGTALAAMDRYYKEKNDGRLTHYEGVTRNRAYETEISDLESRMYASPEAAAKYMEENPAKPFILCEYLYGIGNSGGGMKEYMELFDRFDAFAGGFIWSFMDKALIIKDNITGREVIRCGGEFDDRPSDYSFSADGIMFADGTEKPTMQEVRYFYEKYEA